MNRFSPLQLSKRPLAILFLGLFLLTLPPASCSAATPKPTPILAVAALAAAPPGPPLSLSSASPLFAEGTYWGRVWPFIEHSLSSRAGLLRFGMVGALIALFIIMRNKW